MSKYIYQLVYVDKMDWNERQSYIFATEKDAMTFFNECSEDNHLNSAIYLNKMKRGVDGMFHGHAAKVLYEQ